MKKPTGNQSQTLADWEAICERCGRCCYEKYESRGKIIYTSTPCRYLDKSSGLCRIYPRRSQVHPDCARLTPELVTAGILPADCPYVKDIEDYPAPILKKSVKTSGKTPR